MICWKNGEYVEAQHLQISPFDHGFLYGIGFFETFRTYNGEPFLFEEHMVRLRRALADYDIELQYTNAELKRVVQQLVERSAGQDGYFRLNVSAGNEGLGLQAKRYVNPTIIIFHKELPPLTSEKQAVWLETIRTAPEQAVRHKSHHYGNNILARQEIDSLKDTEGFFLTPEGYVAEGITSTIFWVKDGILYTPALATGILQGITRQFIIQLAEQLNIPIQQGFYTREALAQADECFITTSIQEIIPIKRLEEKQYPSKDGVLYQKIHRLYKKHRGDVDGDAGTL